MMRVRADLLIPLIITFAGIVLCYLLQNVIGVEWGGNIDTTEYMVFLGSSVLAMTGVSITGYIFLLESVRRLGDRDPQKKSVADALRKEIYGELKVLFFLSIVFIIGCGLFVGSITLNLLTLGVSLSLLFFLLCWSVVLDLKMMDFQGKLYGMAERELDKMASIFKNRRMVVRLDAGEFNNSVSGIDAVEADDFVEDYDRGYRAIKRTDVICIRGLDDNYMRGILSGAPGSTMEEDLQDGSDEDVSKKEGSIVPWAVIGYNDRIKADFEAKDALFIFDSIEMILCKIAGVKSDVLSETDRTRIFSALNTGSSYRMEAGIIDDVVQLYYDIKKFRDYYTVCIGKEEEGVNVADDVPYVLPLTIEDGECVGVLNYSDEPMTQRKIRRKFRVKEGRDDLKYLEAITPAVFVMRYELSKKLSGMDLSGLVLTNYDFSYGIMNKVLMKSCMLNGSTFFTVNLIGSVLSDCDLTNADFKESNCDAVDFSGSNLESINFEKCSFNGAQFRGATLTDIRFPVLRMDGATFDKAIMYNCLFRNCRINNSSFSGAKMISAIMDNCLSADSNYSILTLVESMMYSCDFRSTNFIRSAISATILKNSDFIKAMMDDSLITSDLIIDCNFTSAQCNRVNFTGTQFIAVSFESAILSGSNFSRTFIGSRDMSSSDSEWVIRDNIVRDGQEDLRSTIDSVLNREDTSFNPKVREGMKKLMERLPHMMDIHAKHSSFDHAEVTRCLFSDFELCNTSLCGTIFDGSTFNNSKLHHTTFENSSFTGAIVMSSTFLMSNFKSISFKDTTFTDTRFAQCIIRNATFRGSNLTNCAIISSDLSSSSFGGANMINTELRGVRGLNPTLRKCTCSELVLEDCVWYDGTILNGKFTTTEQLLAYLDGVEAKYE